LFPRGKTILAGLLVLALLLSVSGCGTKAASMTSTAPPKAQSGQPFAAAEQVKGLNPTNPQDQGEIDRQIDQKLKSLDASLDALDKSLGSL